MKQAPLFFRLLSSVAQLRFHQNADAMRRLLTLYWIRTVPDIDCLFLRQTMFHGRADVRHWVTKVPDTFVLRKDYGPMGTSAHVFGLRRCQTPLYCEKITSPGRVLKNTHYLAQINIARLPSPHRGVRANSDEINAPRNSAAATRPTLPSTKTVCHCQHVGRVKESMCTTQTRRTRRSFPPTRALFREALKAAPIVYCANCGRSDGNASATGATPHSFWFSQRFPAQQMAGV